MLFGKLDMEAPSGALRLKGRHQSTGVFVHSSPKGTGIPNFLRPFTLWAGPKIALQTGVTNRRLLLFHQFLKCSHLGCRMLWKEKPHSNRPFCCYCYRFAFDCPWLLAGEILFCLPPSPSRCPYPALGLSDVTCWEVMRVGDNQHYCRTETFWLCMG